MSQKSYHNIAVAGATGAVGTLVLQLLEERNFPYQTIRFLASARSAGKELSFKGETHRVQELTPDAFAGVDLVISSLPDDVAKEITPWAVERGAVVIDESGFHRMLPDVPLVIPEVNPEAIFDHKGIIASPNCSTTQMVVALKPLHDAATVTRVVVSTYQSTSGAGLAGSEELQQSTQAVLNSQVFEPSTFSHPIGFNLLPQIGSFKENGYTSEELKMVYETRKILNDESIQ